MGERTWPNLVSTLLRGEDLSTSDAAWAMREVVRGEATPVQTTAFVIALRAKGETAGELAGLVEAMLGAAVRVELGQDVRAESLDIVGTGGDRAHTVNISTMAAIVAAGAGARVVKHGNRAASSLCGTADLLEHLGIPLDLSPAEVARCVREAGIGFCFAPRFHAGLRHASVARREMGVPTVFNFLGPLTNPAQPQAGAVGCADARMAALMAEVFAGRGDTVLVVRGEDGLDEFTTTAPTRVWAVAGGSVTPLVLDAADLGLARGTAADLRGGDATVNAAAARAVLAGEHGPVRDAVLINAAAGLAAHAGWSDPAPASELPASAGTVEAAVMAGLADGLQRAAAAIDSGAAAAALTRWLATAQAVRGTLPD